MDCVEYFADMLRQEGVDVSEEDAEAVGRAIAKATDGRIGPGTCAPDWKLVRQEFSRDPALRKRLVDAVREETGDRSVRIRPKFP